MTNKLVQKAYLNDAKKALEARLGAKLGWDEFALRAGVEPRALKTYRMPEDSKDYRAMPGVVRQAIELLLSTPAKTTSTNALVPALAWLVLSQARIALIDNQPISGLDRRYGARSGLTANERKILSLVSRVSLINGLRDQGGEIHELLENCIKPLGSWLPVPEVMQAGYADTCLIDPDSRMPTPEASELAENFSTLSTHIEEELFSKFKEVLNTYPTDDAHGYYAYIREFIVRNSVVSSRTLFDAGRQVVAPLWMAVHHDYYEPVPAALAENGLITLCAHCNGLLKKVGDQHRCASRACSSVHSGTPGTVLPVAEARRVTRGIRQYWVEPGIDEMRLFDALKARGASPVLYPFSDRVDVALGAIGMDLKIYTSPEILGGKFRRSIGGLAFYEKKWLVIPDWLVQATPSYMERLTTSLGANPRIACLTLSEAIERAATIDKEVE